MDQIQQAVQLGLEVRTHLLPVIIPVQAADTESTTFSLYVYTASRAARLIGVSYVCGDDLPENEDDYAEFSLYSINPSILLAGWSSQAGVAADTVHTVDIGEDGVVIPSGALLRLAITKPGLGVLLPSTTVFLKILPDVPS